MTNSVARKPQTRKIREKSHQTEFLWFSLHRPPPGTTGDDLSQERTHVSRVLKFRFVSIEYRVESVVWVE
ncbi:hypothetical protein DMENIID0001_140690 [Sergentomyia squamirostris]